MRNVRVGLFGCSVLLCGFRRFWYRVGALGRGLSFVLLMGVVGLAEEEGVYAVGDLGGEGDGGVGALDGR